MALVAYPRVIPASIQFGQNDEAVSALYGPFSDEPAQLISRGYMPWQGSLTWPLGLWQPNLDIKKHYDELVAFIDSLEGGTNHFRIPLRVVLKDRPFRFPALDETTADMSVRVTAQTPYNNAAGSLGLASVLTLDTPATATTGLRKGDWISLRQNNDLPHDEVTHRGAYRCFTDQVGNQVSVRPSPPLIDYDAGGRHRVLTREPTLQAFLDGGLPSVILEGAYYQPITIQWREYRDG